VPLRTAAVSKLVGDDGGQHETVLGAPHADLEVEDRLVAGPSLARGLHAEQPECANPDAVCDRDGAIYTNLSVALKMGRRPAERAPNRR
jgi:hypothetical protein